ncbi:MAG: iron-containing alcohol dehydrogenase [Haliea sp.]|jgi:alcohol dehydrogenase|nr:iron-containing alcohol dehydrogenase [Haliea sp.]MDP4790060.1 iron-containing alcohol dehydrogenase [Haliea sp.]MDP5064817.1 iron-containing alcohol dehydrogenase [Haliea sp.]
MSLRKFKHAVTLILMKTLAGLAASPAYMVYIGSGSAVQLCRHMVRSGTRKLLVVTDKPLRDLGIVDQATLALAGSDVSVVIYDGVEPNPTYAQVAAGRALMLEHGCDAVLAIGGGSSIDAAKIIAASATSDEDPKTWVGFGKVKHEVPALYAIPTTAGTGSEATMGAVISDSVTHEKGVISGATLLPAAVALDSDLMLGMPAAITAATGMDALTHAIEAYICVWDRGTRKQHSSMAVRLVFAHLRDAVADGSNREARDAMALGAYYAGIAINQVNVGNVHAIAHQIGGKYGIPHGLANSLVLPHVLKFCRTESVNELAELALLVGVGKPGQSADQLAGQFIDAVIQLRADVGIAETSDRIRSEDYTYLTDLALKECEGYPVPKLLERDATMGILRAITA